MRRIISFAHISLDGFVAEPKGEMVKKGQPLFRLETQSLSQDAGFLRFEL